MKKWMNAKVVYRLCWLGYWGLVFLVSPLFLFCLFVYGIVLLMSKIADKNGIKELKWVLFGKSDAALTQRKLFYVLKTAHQLNIMNAKKHNTFFEYFEAGSFDIDEYLSIKMTIDDIYLRSELYFKGNLIATSKGFSFQKVKWDLSDMPTVQKTVAKFLEKVDEMFEKEKRNTKQVVERKKSEEKKEEEKKRRQIEKEAKETYKKEINF